MRFAFALLLPVVYAQTPCIGNVSMNIDGPTCESTCSTQSEFCTINVERQCSERNTEYECLNNRTGSDWENDEDLTAIFTCHWIEASSQCMNQGEFCYQFNTNQTECDSHSQCEYNSDLTACVVKVAPQAQHTVTYDCISCSDHGDQFLCQNYLFCHWNSNNDTCVRSLAAPAACPASSDDDDKKNMGLILGLSLGLGIPVVALAGWFWYTGKIKEIFQGSPTRNEFLLQ